jgi:hypothetical protein
MEAKAKIDGRPDIKIWDQTWEMATDVNKLPSDLLPPKWDGVKRLAILTRDGKPVGVKELSMEIPLKETFQEAKRMFDIDVL